MKCLIVKTSALGDLVHVFPVVDYLKAINPEIQIDWVVEKGGKDLLMAHPSLRRVITIDTKFWRKNYFSNESRQGIKQAWNNLRLDTYDILFDLQGNVKSGLITWAARATHKIGFGRQTVPEWPNLLFSNYRFNPPAGKNIREDYLHLVQSYLKNHPTTTTSRPLSLSIPEEQQQQVNKLLNDPALAGKKKMVICQGSNWASKQLKFETLKEFLIRLHQNEDWSFLFLWGTPQEKEKAFELQQTISTSSVVVERMSLPAVQVLMGQVDAVFSVDSLPLHLAGTTKTHTFSVFGPSSANKYQPLGDRHTTLQGNCPYGRTFEKRCPILRSCPTAACIKDISVDDLWNAFKKSLSICP